MADTKKTHFPSEETMARCADALEVLAGVQTPVDKLDYAGIQQLVRTGHAAKYLKVGDQILVPYKDDTYDLTLRLDVLHHFDGSDDDHPLMTLEGGEQRPGMLLGMHNAFPMGVVFCPKQAFMYATEALAAGTYNFTVNTTVKWGSGVAGAVGQVTYQFTTTKAMAAGAQMVWNASDSAKPTSATVYSGPASDTAVETVAISVGSSGTSLGTMSENSSDEGLNNIQRSCFGSNRWSASQLRMWLNSDGACAHTYGKFDRPFPLVGKNGFLAGLDGSFVKTLAKMERKTETHAFDGGAVETTYDRAFPVSVREHYFSNYLSATSDGYKAEGVVLDYWKQLAVANGRTSTWAGWGTFPELITYDAASPTVGRYVWLRSANRYVSSARTVGCVNSGGGVNSTGATYSYCAVPALPIA